MKYQDRTPFFLTRGRLSAGALVLLNGLILLTAGCVSGRQQKTAPDPASHEESRAPAINQQLPAIFVAGTVQAKASDAGKGTRWLFGGYRDCLQWGKRRFRQGAVGHRR